MGSASDRLSRSLPLPSWQATMPHLFWSAVFYLGWAQSQPRKWWKRFWYRGRPGREKTHPPVRRLAPRGLETTGLALQFTQIFCCRLLPSTRHAFELPFLQVQDLGFRPFPVSTSVSALKTMNSVLQWGFGSAVLSSAPTDACAEQRLRTMAIMVSLTTEVLVVTVAMRWLMMSLCMPSA